MVAFVPRLRPLFITCSMEVGDTWEGGCADEVLLGRAWASPTLAWSTGPRASTNRPTDSVCPIHVILIHCTCPHYHAVPPCHVHVNSAVRSCDSYKTKNGNNGKVKSRPTPVQRTARLEWERDQRASSYLRFFVGVAMHPWVSRTSVFLAGHFIQALFHTFLQKYNMCTLDSG